MRVKSVTVHQVRIPLRKRIKHASHVRTDTENLVVAVQLNDGAIGYGEGVPREYVTGETIEASMALLRQMDRKPFAQDYRSFEEAVSAAQLLSLPATLGDDRLCQGNGARCAVELAFLDAFGKHFRRPLSDVTKLLEPELYEPRARVQYSGVITSARGHKARIAAMIMWLYGFRQLKVKVGIVGYDDPQRLATIRRRVGPKMDIRVDANEAWSPGEAAECMRALEPFNISSVEQPLSHADIAHLPELRRQIHTHIMLDESLCSEIDANRAADGGLCDLFNLRLSKCGGFTRSLRIARIAKDRGLASQLGCQVGETAILSAAGRHFAASVAGLRYLEGSYDQRLVTEALGKKNITFGWGGWASALGGGGLGIEIDDVALRRVTFHSEQIFV
jgi:L-alanine-DL-glutamate epimerase-like enolase superfamily enzyme